MTPHTPGFFNMLDKKMLSIILIIPLLLVSPVKAREVNPDSEQKIVAKKLDKRAEILSAYLGKFNSPLQYHSQDFIDAADKYDLDWKLVPAIAGVESTFGKNIPGGFNGWGWGVYGTQAIYFKSWNDGIFTVSEGLRKGYLDRGLTNPYTINKVYATSPFWGRNVTYFLQDLEKFEKDYWETDTIAK